MSCVSTDGGVAIVITDPIRDCGTVGEFDGDDT